MVGAFDRNPARQLAELKRQVADLERRLGGAAGSPTTAGVGPGVSTAFGGLSVRPTQVGFPAELTSAWDATTGYAWKQLALDGVALVAPAVQLSGTNAVAADGSTSLASGAQGWMEPDPQAGGWVFVRAGSGGGFTPTATRDGGPTVYAIAADSTWEDPGITLTAPATGSYLVLAVVCMSGLADTPVQMRARLLVNGAVAAGGWMKADTAVSRENTITLVSFNALTSGQIAKVQVWRDPATWTDSSVWNTGNLTSFIQLVRLA